MSVCTVFLLYIVFSEQQRHEDGMRRELEDLKRKVAYLEKQLLLKKQPEPLKFNVSDFHCLFVRMLECLFVCTS